MGIHSTKFSVVLLLAAWAAISTRLVYSDLNPNSSTEQPPLATTQDSENHINPNIIRPWNPYDPQECFRATSSVTRNCFSYLTRLLPMPFHISSNCCMALDYEKEKCKLHVFSSLTANDPLKFLRVSCVRESPAPPPSPLGGVIWSLSPPPPPLPRIWNPYNPQECLEALLRLRNKCKLGISHSLRLPSVDPTCCKALGNVEKKCKFGPSSRKHSNLLGFLEMACSKTITVD